MEKDCLFCNIVKGNTDTEFLFETEDVVVFKDIHPHAPVHLLIVPKQHIRSVNDLTDEDRAIVAELLMTGKAMARRQHVADKGTRSRAADPCGVQWGVRGEVWRKKEEM